MWLWRGEELNYGYMLHRVLAGSARKAGHPMVIASAG